MGRSRIAEIVAGRSVIVASAAALAATAMAVMVGGIPLAVALAGVVVGVLALLPASPRQYLLRRVGRAAFSLFFAMAIVWLLVHNYPDLSRSDEPGLVPAMRRYIDWIGGVVAGELGPSQYSESVGTGVARSLPISLQLVLYSQVMAILIAVPAALIGARMRGRVGDIGVRAINLLGLSLPIFVIGPLLIQLFALGDMNLFGARVGWKVLPAVRYEPLGDGLVEHVRSMLLPSLTLALNTAAVYLVLLRSELIQQLRLPHVELARSKGLPPRRILTRHSLRPASPTSVAGVAAQSGFVLGNVIIIERIFSIPGFGDYTLVAIGRRDVLAVAGAMFVAALVMAVVNLVADALLLVLDPRLTS